MIFQFLIFPIIIWLVVFRVSWFHNKGLDVLVLHVTKWTFIEVAVMIIEESCLIVDSGGAAYGG